MRSEKGITLISVIVYVAAFFTISVIVAQITGFFYSNMSEMEDSTSANAEYNTFNMYMLKETKIGKNYVEYARSFTKEEGAQYKDEATGETSANKKIVYKFSSGTTFTYINQKIYRNSVKICDNISDFGYKANSVVEEGKNVIEIYMQINDIAYRTSYIVSQNTNTDNQKAILGKINDGQNLTMTGGEPSSNNPVIPSGFMPINYVLDETITQAASWLVSTENSISGANQGVVIQDIYGNQFVWIPVHNIEDFKTYARYEGDTLYRNSTGDDYAAGLTEEIVKKSIEQYGGFYIARYPVSERDGTISVAISETDTNSVFKTYQYETARTRISQIGAGQNKYSQLSIPSQTIYDTIYKFLNLTKDTKQLSDDADKNIEGLTGKISTGNGEISLQSVYFWTNSKGSNDNSKIGIKEKIDSNLPTWERYSNQITISSMVRPVMYILPTE